MRTMTTFPKANPLNVTLDFSEERLHDNVLSLVIFAIDQKGWDGNLMEVFLDSPGFESAYHTKF